MSYEETIFNRIEDHYKAAIEHGFSEENILGIFLYGSQNYKVDTIHSDVDTKLIVIPTFEELVFNRGVSTCEMHLPNGEHCEVMDIRHLVDNFKKQNINFLEVLFTEFFVVNAKYEQIWNDFFIAKREEICHYDICRAVHSICGQAIHTLKQDSFNGKKVANGKRLLYFLTQYIQNAPYEDCIVPPEELRHEILELKSMSEPLKIDMATELVAKFETISAAFQIPDPAAVPSKDYIDAFMRAGIMELIKEADGIKFS